MFKFTYQKFPTLDIVINNAGLLQDKFWQLELDVNVVSWMNPLREFKPGYRNCDITNVAKAVI